MKRRSSGTRTTSTRSTAASSDDSAEVSGVAGDSADLPGGGGEQVGSRRFLPFRGASVGYLFLLPALAILFAFVALPIIDALIMSFQRVTLRGDRSFVGLDNYRLLLSQARFMANIRYSLIYLVGVLALALPLGYLAALLLNSGGTLSGLFRTLFLLPWILTTVVTALIFRSLVDPVSGPVAALLTAITGEPQYFLIDPTLAMLTVIVHSAWRSFPLVMLFLSAGMAAIPREIYDAASIDGASGWRLFRHITLPLTQTQLFITALVISAFTLQDAEGVFALTGGGPGQRTEVLAVRLMQEAFRNLNLGLASAISVALLVLGFAVMLLYLRIMREERT